MKRSAALLHTFSRPRTPGPGTKLSWDRCEAQRRDASWLSAQAASPKARSLLLHKDDVAVREAADGSSTVIAWAEGPVAEVGTCAFFLGVDGDKTPSFVRRLTAAEAKAADPKLKNLRSVASDLAPMDAHIVAHGKSLVEWHESAMFCGYCGGPTTCGGGGSSRVCSRDACRKETYPRTNPVAIMAVASPDNTRLLIGQSRGRMQSINLYSVLAGFVDQGESLEDAVRREVMEEAGIRVDEVRYHSSQPWPYPHALMLGCLGRATHDDINFDKTEMVDVRWATRAELRVAFAALEDPLSAADGGLSLPPRAAIAHHLIRSWLDEGDDAGTKPAHL